MYLTNPSFQPTSYNVGLHFFLTDDKKFLNFFLIFKSKSAKKYLEYIVACLCSITTEIFNIPDQSIYFMDGFTF